MSGDVMKLTREDLDAFARRGPFFASYAQFLEETGKVEFIEQKSPEEVKA